MVAEDGAMSAPGVFVEFVEVLNQFGPERVEVNIANQFEEVWVLFADDGLVSVLEEMACPFVAFIKGDGVSGHAFAHNLAEGGRAGAQEKVKMVRD